MTIPRISKAQLDDANSATLVKQYQRDKIKLMNK